MPPSNTPQRARWRGGSFFLRGFLTLGATAFTLAPFFARPTGSSGSFGIFSAASSGLRTSRRFLIRPATGACFLLKVHGSPAAACHPPPPAVDTQRLNLPRG